MDHCFSVVTVNVRGMRDTFKRRLVFDYIGSLNAYFSLLQEVHVRDEQM